MNMTNEEFQKLVLEKFADIEKNMATKTELRDIQQNMATKTELREIQQNMATKTELRDILASQVKFESELRDIKASQARMENEMGQKITALFDAREVQKDYNEKIFATLERLEAKIDALQVETAHIPQVKGRRS